MLRVPSSHKAQIRCVIGILQGWFLEPPLKQPHSRANVLVSGWHLSCALRTAFCSNTHVHKHFVEPTASPPDEPKKVRTNPFYLETVRRKIWDRLGFKTNLNWNSSCALRSLLLPHSSDNPGQEPLERLILRNRLKSQGCIYLYSADLDCQALFVEKMYV